MQPVIIIFCGQIHAINNNVSQHNWGLYLQLVIWIPCSLSPKVERFYIFIYLYISIIRKAEIRIAHI
jgi:hypothetical protein